jgi:RND family efflux transporter MFP subunit
MTAPLNDVGHGPSTKAAGLAIAIGFVVAISVSLIVWKHRSEARASSAMAGSQKGLAMPGSQKGLAMPGMSMSANGAVKLTADQMRQFGVTFATVQMRTLSAETRATGVVTIDETKLAQVAPRIGGFVERLWVDATGQPVRRGQPLLELYSPDLVSAQQDLLVASQLQRDLGRTAVPGVAGNNTDLLEAAKRRLRLWDISDAQIEAVLRTGQVRRTLTLFAPAGGVVTEKKVVQGQSIGAGEQLYTIADLSDVWLDVQLRESDVPNVRSGSGADVELTALPGREIKGRVGYVYPVLDSAARTVRARIVVANTNALLKPGMYATVRLRTPSRSALTVPDAAVLRTGDRNVVFVSMDDGALMPHEVQLGLVAGDYAEVLAGLEPGQRVVTSAQFLLDSESNLAEVMRAMMSQMSSGDAKKMQDMPGMKTPAQPAPRR